MQHHIQTTITNNESPSLCSGCGACCKRGAGIIFPTDFKEITVEVLIEKIRSGFCFDYWEGDPTVIDFSFESDFSTTAYYMRPKHKDAEDKVVDSAWGHSTCIFHSEDKGCALTFEQRPTQCRALMPSEDKLCGLPKGFSKREASIAWLPYNGIILKAIKLCEEYVPRVETSMG